ncbi:MAG TPA: hypothetical protein VNI01_15430 [Elusimicrobiota bacterium]|nr:hypothetical protein [Elusimicrobiota bacterium]
MIIKRLTPALLLLAFAAPAHAGRDALAQAQLGADIGGAAIASASSGEASRALAARAFAQDPSPAPVRLGASRASPVLHAEDGDKKDEDKPSAPTDQGALGGALFGALLGAAIGFAVGGPFGAIAGLLVGLLLGAAACHGTV